MRLASPRLASSILAVLFAPLLACGDDDGTSPMLETGLPMTDGTSSTGEASTSTSADTGSTGTTAAVDDTTATATAASTDDGSTTGPLGDPAYPPPDGGTCPDDTLPVALPGAEICAPFCAGPDDPCPMPASGDAVPQCTPFAGEGGSGDACSDAIPCPDGELCSEKACVMIAFHACQLSCAMNETCPDDMQCSGIAVCGYP
jgi:hypothetical protein